MNYLTVDGKQTKFRVPQEYKLNLDSMDIFQQEKYLQSN